MRNFVLSTCLLIGVSGLKAQLPDLGQVKITITPVGQGNTGDVPAGSYVFSAASGSNQGYSWSSGKEYIDCSYGTDFTRSKPINITGSFRIWHPQAGKFLMRNGADGDDPPDLATFRLIIDNSVVLSGDKKGTSGTITVTSLGPGKNGWVTGSFDVTVGDSPDPNAILHLFRVTGEFKLNSAQ
ncbi:MAG TPA: hypothetical protein VL978_06290 [Puia sp.]|nr:hypothetical protein [Puia sp.]